MNENFEEAHGEVMALAREIERLRGEVIAANKAIEEMAVALGKQRKADDDGYGGSVIATTVKCLEEAEADNERLRGELESAESDGEDMRQVRLQLYAEIDRLRGLLRECEPAVYAQHMDTLGTRIAKPATLLARVRAALAGATDQPNDALIQSAHVELVPWCNCCVCRVPIDHVCECEKWPDESTTDPTDGAT